MDPLSIAASITALLQLTGSVLTYLNDVKNAPKDRAKIAVEAAAVYSLLTILRDRVEDAKSTDPWYMGIRTLGAPLGVLDQYKAALEQLATKLAPGDVVRKVGRALMWTFDKKEINEILAKIERLKTLISLALQNDLNALSKAIKNDVSVLREQVGQMYVDHYSEERQKIADWLSPLDFKSRQRDIFSRRQEGTGQWLLESPEFGSWLEQPRQELWCPGIPGAGKTIFASIAVDYLQHTFKDQGVRTVCIYCNYKERIGRGSQDLLASILKQLVQDCASLSDDLKKLYHENKMQKNVSLPLEELMEALRLEASRCSKIFVVVDALDECAEESNTRLDLLRGIRSLQGNISLLVTSRRVPIIENEFRETTSLEIYASNKDATNYILRRIQRESRLAGHVKADHGLETAIINGILPKANGMFLLVQLHMDVLVNKNNRKAIYTALKNLHKGIEDTYEEALERVQNQNQDDRELANKTLLWISFALRPLSITELQHALAVEKTSTKTELDALPDENVIINVCAGLIIVDENSNVRLVHYTLKEYLDRVRDSRYPNAQDSILNVCITYLLFDEFQAGYCRTPKAFESRIEHNALLGYISSSWGYHSLGDIQSDTEAALLRFLLNDGAVSSCSQALIAGHPEGFRYDEDPASITVMHLTAYFGMFRFASRLLKIGASADPSTSLGRTPLSIAAERGFKPLVKMLISRNDVNINFQDCDGLAPLHWAASQGSDAVKLLLDAGAIVDIRNNRNQTPLHLGAEKGSRKVVRILLKTGADVNALSDTKTTPLYRAARRGHWKAMRVLLDHNADVDQRTFDGYTALRSAVGYHQTKTVRELLTAKPNLYFVGTDGLNAVEVAQKNGDKKIAKMLEEEMAARQEPTS